MTKRRNKFKLIQIINSIKEKLEMKNPNQRCAHWACRKYRELFQDLPSTVWSTAARCDAYLMSCAERSTGCVTILVLGRVIILWRGVRKCHTQVSCKPKPPRISALKHRVIDRAGYISCYVLQFRRRHEIRRSAILVQGRSDASWCQNFPIWT